MIYIGLDDTDNQTSRGTGRLARDIAGVLANRFRIRGVTRHQLLVDPRVPYTSHNSCAVIHLHDDPRMDLAALADEVQAIMLADFQPGSDPGLCVTRMVPSEMIDFGRCAKVEVVGQSVAREIAARCGCILRGLGGTEDGVIGALAGIGLAATGEDGRFLLVGRSRELNNVETVEALLAFGVAEVRTLEGNVLTSGRVETNGKVLPAFRANQPVLFVARKEGEELLWSPVKLD